MSVNKGAPDYAVVIWDDAWSDAVASTTVKDAKELHRASRFETRGWLLVDDSEGISIFPERCLDNGDEIYRGRTFIPRSLVKAVTIVKLSSPRKPKSEKVPPRSDSPPG